MTLFINKTQLREYIRTQRQLDTSIEFYTGIDEKIRQLIEESCSRAEENGRKTVMKRDL